MKRRLKQFGQPEKVDVRSVAERGGMEVSSVEPIDRRDGSVTYAAIDQDANVDHYETLQIGINAEPETIHRVYRLLAQRFSPDNKETGNATRFRLVSEAYSVLSNPERRARYDVAHHQRQQDRWRIASKGPESRTTSVSSSSFA